ncbi:isoprenylcysteine carboxylmethyltransferase family protein [soil metagenome]
MSAAQDRTADPRPRSAVGHGVGLAGLAGLLAWTAVGWNYGMDGPYAGIAAMVACGVPMLLWSLLVDKVHRNPTTGIDWDGAPRPLKDVLDVSLVKLTGLWATWGGIAILYCLARWYWDGSYRFAMQMFGVAAPWLLALSIPYVLWLDRRLAEPRDAAYAFGQWVIGGAAGSADRAEVANHLRAWAVKAFFLAFMLSIVPANFANVVHWKPAEIVSSPVALANSLIALMFLIDVAFATVGYMLTMKPLDAHIRSANPYMAGWVAALICYPPFVLMGPGGPLDYHHSTAEWSHWLSGSPAALWSVGAVLVALTAVYAWATVAFGMRFSNLTHRGILTHWPYSWTRHPAYLSKNLFWWLSTLPFLVTSGSLIDMARNTATLAAVSAIYYWRARTEERHLSADPAYRAYSDWMARNGAVPRLIAWATRRKTLPLGMQPAE